MAVAAATDPSSGALARRLGADGAEKVLAAIRRCFREIRGVIAGHPVKLALRDAFLAEYDRTLGSAADWDEMGDDDAAAAHAAGAFSDPAGAEGALWTVADAKSLALPVAAHFPLATVGARAYAGALSPSALFSFAPHATSMASAVGASSVVGGDAAGAGGGDELSRPWPGFKGTILWRPRSKDWEDAELAFRAKRAAIQEELGEPLTDESSERLDRATYISLVKSNAAVDDLALRDFVASLAIFPSGKTAGLVNGYVAFIGAEDDAIECTNDLLRQMEDDGAWRPFAVATRPFVPTEIGHMMCLTLASCGFVGKMQSRTPTFFVMHDSPPRSPAPAVMFDSGFSGQLALPPEHFKGIHAVGFGNTRLADGTPVKLITGAARVSIYSADGRNLVADRKMMVSRLGEGSDIGLIGMAALEPDESVTVFGKAGRGPVWCTGPPRPPAADAPAAAGAGARMETDDES